MKHAFLQCIINLKYFLINTNHKSHNFIGKKQNQQVFKLERLKVTTVLLYEQEL